MEVVLEENGVLEYTQTNIPKLVAIDTHQLTQWKKDTTKTRMIILEGIKDYVVSSFHGKKTTYAMWKPLIELFKRNSDAIDLALKDKLKNIRMQKNETIGQFLSRFIQL